MNLKKNYVLFRLFHRWIDTKNKFPLFKPSGLIRMEYKICIVKVLLSPPSASFVIYSLAVHSVHISQKPIMGTMWIRLIRQSAAFTANNYFNNSLRSVSLCDCPFNNSQVLINSSFYCLRHGIVMKKSHKNSFLDGQQVKPFAADGQNKFPNKIKFVG